MKDPVFGDEQVEFPVEVHFRIVARAEDPVATRIHAAAEQLGIADHLRPGNLSASGTYHSHQLSLVVHSLERMQEIDRTFRAIDGVKMVL